MAHIILENSLIVITGAGSGIGRGMALGLAACGATIVAADISLEGAEGTAAQIAAAGGSAFPVRLDVTDLAECRHAAAHIQEAMGSCRALINSAGISRRVTVDDPEVRTAWDECLAVNATGSFNMALAFLDQLRITKGSIINIASIAGVVTTRTFPGYNASKAAVIGLTRSLAQKLAKDGVRVDAILPGAITTPMTTALRADPEAVDYFIRRTPMGRFGKPEDLVGPAAFLASDLSAYVTGTTLAVDGGLLAE
ncbi:SDR family NAD(P)-dependent oxidoreductase [Sphingobium sp. V4]|uniref:SDR family NAD(P)-dependent oxidoreductase n=1 Tax=Sphingobium sp. V4 TaxID=3038927 RepID=UPI002557FD18|nr:SDR family NAD(P)-dependent oxidoreductase [Sphingobium sp. V4]WIW89415.1 SDR family NAD(P)-dependent oxidoreductase [Sphingobium sp. V4]